jgi:hypothetical protein
VSNSTISDADRRLAAKRLNEHLRLLVTSLNALALTMFGAAFILPSVSGTPEDPLLFWILTAAGLHFLAHSLIRIMKSEE